MGPFLKCDCCLGYLCRDCAPKKIHIYQSLCCLPCYDTCPKSGLNCFLESGSCEKCGNESSYQRNLSSYLCRYLGILLPLYECLVCGTRFCPTCSVKNARTIVPGSAFPKVIICGCTGEPQWEAIATMIDMKTKTIAKNRMSFLGLNLLEQNLLKKPDVFSIHSEEERGRRK